MFWTIILCIAAFAVSMFTITFLSEAIKAGFLEIWLEKAKKNFKAGEPVYFQMKDTSRFSFFANRVGFYLISIIIFSLITPMDVAFDSPLYWLVLPFALELGDWAMKIYLGAKQLKQQSVSES
jgi:hypothetical protein